MRPKNDKGLDCPNWVSNDFFNQIALKFIEVKKLFLYKDKFNMCVC